jgi:hypothetical protein
MKRNMIALGACLVALGVGAASAVLASSVAASPVPQAGPPSFVTTCLKLESGPARAACFASSAPASSGAVNRVPDAGPPSFVTACLQVQPGAARAACFVSAAGGHIPEFVRRCLAAADRGHCFRAHFLSAMIRRK